jgi:hypothetical protein
LEVDPVAVGQWIRSSTWGLVAAALGASTFGVVGLLAVGEVLLLGMRLPMTSAGRAWRMFGLATISTGLSTGTFATVTLALRSNGSEQALTWAVILGGFLVLPGLIVGAVVDVTLSVDYYRRDRCVA